MILVIIEKMLVFIERIRNQNIDVILDQYRLLVQSKVIIGLLEYWLNILSVHHYKATAISDGTKITDGSLMTTNLRLTNISHDMIIIIT